MSLIIEALSKARQQKENPAFLRAVPELEKKAVPPADLSGRTTIFPKQTRTFFVGLILIGTVTGAVFQWGRVPGSSPVPNAPLVQGVFLDDKEPLCLIEGKIFKVGDTWNGRAIASIRQEGVTFEK